MKKWIALLLAVIMTFALVACGEKPDAGNDTPTDAAPADAKPAAEEPDEDEGAVALTVGEHDVSPWVYNYFYQTTYSQIASSYGYDALSYLADYITEQTNKNIRDAYAVYDAAKEAGESLSDDIRQQIESHFEQLRKAAADYGSADLDAFLAAVYGKGCNERNYREYLEVQTLATIYTQKERSSFASSITKEKFTEYYQRNMLNFDTVTFRAFLVPVAENRDMDATEKYAKEMEKLITTDLAAFAKMAHDLANEEEAEYYADENATLVKDEKINYVENDLHDWMADPARKEGDTRVVRSGDSIGTFVVCFYSRDNHNYPSANIRHLLVRAADDGEASKSVAKNQAQFYLDEYLAGEKTEDAFAALAKAHSEADAANGGLLENVTKGQIVTAFEDWCFEPGRKPGDTGLVETEEGFHVMYYCGEGINSLWKMVTDEMQENHQIAWLMRLTENYEIKVNEDGMKLTTRLISDNAQNAANP